MRLKLYMLVEPFYSARTGRASRSSEAYYKNSGSFFASLKSFIFFAFKSETSTSSFGIITSWCFLFSSSFWLLNRASSSDNETKFPTCFKNLEIYDHANDICCSNIMPWNRQWARLKSPRLFQLNQLKMQGIYRKVGIHMNSIAIARMKEHISQIYLKPCFSSTLPIFNGIMKLSGLVLLENIVSVLWDSSFNSMAGSSLRILL